ncbi:cupin domain-containing protein [Sphingobium vermicomposti]|uniref:50S ribosomal protein L16 3-hydroxylase n=1 Tax=Sphingobium vermicomposti TaxID=529005 RepID=A0A846MI32_9SPHN|nr:cupin domain-containing protein [Sphingobium vermicomposti]NIJ18256.1 50S ribosomal protein L16 3-hydroxylase [Sphingobium vermicomposti]
MQIHNFDIDLFLREYWQKKPLLIRNPWTAWSNPLEPDELAGLACEEDVESRLIERTGDNWTLDHGPFAPERFGALGGQPWTLLVQAVDHHAPDVAALIHPFRFVPNWRIDDVMVSYASDRGGVGPHFDQYDVFLLQGLGKRRWRVGGLCDEASILLPHDELRLLATFEAKDEWVLEPGDILYVPPGYAHDGVAVGDGCMTYSIGFRAPSQSELIEGWCDHLVDTIQRDDRYADPDLQAQDNPGEISADALARLRGMMTQKLLDPQGFARWFGEFNSSRKYADADWRPEEPVQPDELRARLASGVALLRNPASRFSFIRGTGDAVLLFADGQSFDCSGEAAAFARQICAQDHVLASPALADSPPCLTLIAALIDQGSIAVEED